jgi:hypothetical protein
MFDKISWSLILFAGTIATIYLCSRITTLECNRDRDGIISGKIICTGINNYWNEVQILPGDLLRAELKTISDSESTEHSVELVLSSKTMLLSSGISSPDCDDITDKVNRINYFIETSSEQSISIVQDDRFIGYLGGFSFSILGLISIWN